MRRSAGPSENENASSGDVPNRSGARRCGRNVGGSSCESSLGGSVAVLGSARARRANVVVRRRGWRHSCGDRLVRVVGATRHDLAATLAEQAGRMTLDPRPSVVPQREDGVDAAGTRRRCEHRRRGDVREN